MIGSAENLSHSDQLCSLFRNLTATWTWINLQLKRKAMHCTAPPIVLILQTRRHHVLLIGQIQVGRNIQRHCACTFLLIGKSPWYCKITWNMTSHIQNTFTSHIQFSDLYMCYVILFEHGDTQYHNVARFEGLCGKKSIHL